MSSSNHDFQHYRHDLVPLARELRTCQTDQERHLWYGWMRKSQLKFQRQKPIGDFVVDFYCHAAKLVVELDGIQHFTKEALAYDKQRTLFLESRGLKVLRFRNQAVDDDIGAVWRNIESVALERMKPKRAARCTPPVGFAATPRAAGGGLRPTGAKTK